MTKNIIVVDEQGNEYGATYPKRAKGLVKNGRARFIDENKICLACPPSEFLEDNMNQNIINEQTAPDINTEKPLTAKEIFEKIAELQKQLTESSYHSLHRLSDSVINICEGEDEEKVESITEVCNVFELRETTLMKILEFYEKMYEDLRPATMQDKISLVQNSFVSIADTIAVNCDSKDACDTLLDIAEKIKELIEEIIKY